MASLIFAYIGHVLSLAHLHIWKGIFLIPHVLSVFEGYLIFLVYCTQYADNCPLFPDLLLRCVLSCSPLFVCVFLFFSEAWSHTVFTLSSLYSQERPRADCPAFPSVVYCQAQFYLVSDNTLPTKVHCQSPPCSCPVRYVSTLPSVLMCVVNSFQDPDELVTCKSCALSTKVLTSLH